MVNNLISFLTTSDFTSEYIDITSTKPADIYNINFCDHQYVSLIYTTDRKIVSLSFRVNTQTKEIEFFGERVVRKRPEMSNEQIVKKIMRV